MGLAQTARAVLLLLAPACAPGGGSNGAAPLHPLLLVRAGDFAELRARAARSPWRELAVEAQRYAQQESFDPQAPEFEAKTRLTDLCGALALAYVLDPRAELVTKLRATLALWPDFYLASSPSGDGLQIRWRQAAMLMSVLALDVMHDALLPDELATLEGMLDGMITQWWELRAQDGTTSTPGLTTVWALYEGDRARLAEAKALYRERLLGALTPSGVYESGPGYAWVRHGGDRLAKYGPIDILEFTGEDHTLYTDPRLKGLFEWMFGGAFTPQRTNPTFGDSDPSRELEGLLGYMQPYQAGRFSAVAGRNAAWLVRDVTPRPILPNYVLLDDTFVPEPPSSRVWGDAATFWEDGASPESLLGALWNPRSSGTHSHKDVNAVHLCAYGKTLLRNSGYCGAGVGIDATFDWDWVSTTAASSNTVTLGAQNHADKSGGGIVEGLTSPGLDYAAGSAGPAWTNGAHTRSLLLVHGEPARAGYFVLLDEVAADVPGAEVRLALHPEASSISTQVARSDYESRVGVPGDEVVVTFFLGTQPSQASVLDGGLCAFDGNEFVGRYLETVQPTDSAGRANLVTLIVPHDTLHPRPGLERIALAGTASGARVLFASGDVDVVLAASSSAPVVLGPESFLGRAAHFRRVQGALTQYFVRVGREFDDGGTQRVGFDSDADISLIVRGTAVRVRAASGATVTFHDPAIAGNQFVTPVGSIVSSQPGRLEIALLPGTHAFDLNTGALLARQGD